MNKKDTYVKLNKENLMREILLNDGYFTEQIPPCFNSKKIAKNNPEKICSKIRSMSTQKELASKCFPIEITVFKDDILRRTLHFPNIIKYLFLLDKLRTRFNIYSPKLQSSHSEMNALILRKIDYPSNFRESIINRNKLFVGNKYQLKIDIANCYQSIYAHSITWAMVGKDLAKQIYLKIISPNSEYNSGNDLDRCVCALNGNQTNGIVVGPYTSRIISEIILCEIDRELENKNYQFCRYVDDYNFYFTNRYECEHAISNIAKILDKYNLHINASKIKITEYPFDVLDDYSSYFKSSLNNKYVVYDVLQKAAKMEREGKKGSYKYALKFILENDKIDLERLTYNESELIFDLLLTILINKPFISRYVVELISKLRVEFSSDDFVDVLNRLLKSEIAAQHDQEVLWLLYIIFRYHSRINKENIISILENGNDLERIIILDLISKHINYIINMDDEFIKEIKGLFTKLNAELKEENFYTNRWLIKYEIVYNGFNPYNCFDDLEDFKDNKIYKIFAEKQISFYLSVFNN